MTKGFKRMHNDLKRCTVLCTLNTDTCISLHHFSILCEIIVFFFLQKGTEQCPIRMLSWAQQGNDIIALVHTMQTLYNFCILIFPKAHKIFNRVLINKSYFQCIETIVWYRSKLKFSWFSFIAKLKQKQSYTISWKLLWY